MKLKPTLVKMRDWFWVIKTGIKSLGQYHTTCREEWIEIAVEVEYT